METSTGTSFTLDVSDLSTSVNGQCSDHGLVDCTYCILYRQTALSECQAALLSNAKYLTELITLRAHLRAIAEAVTGYHPPDEEFLRLRIIEPLHLCASELAAFDVDPDLRSLPEALGLRDCYDHLHKLSELAQQFEEQHRLDY
jgi:hypothetical protein